jgi:hypothetical protein
VYLLFRSVEIRDVLFGGVAARAETAVEIRDVLFGELRRAPNLPCRTVTCCSGQLRRAPKLSNQGRYSLMNLYMTTSR